MLFLFSLLDVIVSSEGEYIVFVFKFLVFLSIYFVDFFLHILLKKKMPALGQVVKDRCDLSPGVNIFEV